jgi:hypothetical protein
MQISSLVEKYLPSLHNIMYSFSSSVKDLTPEQSTRATLLKLISVLSKQRAAISGQQLQTARTPKLQGQMPPNFDTN